MNTQHITFIGAGNMAHSLVGGLIADRYPARQISVSDINKEHLDHFKQLFHVNVFSDNLLAASRANVIILAVKPQNIVEICRDIAMIVKGNKPLIITIAAGIKMSTISQYFGEDAPIIRCMPNTPALVGSGATGMLANRYVTPAQAELAESIMRAAGVTVWLESEEQLNIVTALSGSGPAYYFLFMEVLQQAAVEAGLDSEIAELLSEQTALGAAHMALEADRSLAQLREQVTSPAGTTAAAIAVMEKHNLAGILKEAFKAALNRARELSIEGDEIDGE